MKANQTQNATDVQIFHFENAQQVRTNLINGEPWFVAYEVCRILGIKNARKAVNDVVDADERYTSLEVTCGKPGARRVWHVNESGLYALIFQSRKPEAKKFRKWVTSEVLPAIRKTSGYGIDQSAEVEKWKTEADTWKRRHIVLKSQRRRRGWDEPKPIALAPAPSTATPHSPAYRVSEFLREACEFSVRFDAFGESEDGRVLREWGDYNRVDTDIHSVIGQLSDSVGRYLTTEYLNPEPEIKQLPA